MARVYSLLFLLIGVDVALGPLLTAVVASPTKPPLKLRHDILVIVTLQAAAFSYGIYAIALGRPVHLAFEGDRFRVISATNVDPDLLPEAPADLRTLPWTGPTLIAAEKPLGSDEQFRSIELGFAGFDISMIPRNWRTYASQSGTVWNAGRPLTKVINQYPTKSALVEALVRQSGCPVEDLRFLPIISRHGDWIAVISSSEARLVGYLPLPGFF